MCDALANVAQPVPVMTTAGVGGLLSDAVGYVKEVLP